MEGDYYNGIYNFKLNISSEVLVFAVANEYQSNCLTPAVLEDRTVINKSPGFSRRKNFTPNDGLFHKSNHCSFKRNKLYLKFQNELQ
jgi:hypothetical protein